MSRLTAIFVGLLLLFATASRSAVAQMMGPAKVDTTLVIPKEARKLLGKLECTLEVGKAHPGGGRDVTIIFNDGTGNQRMSGIQRVSVKGDTVFLSRKYDAPMRGPSGDKVYGSTFKVMKVGRQYWLFREDSTSTGVISTQIIWWDEVEPARQPKSQTRVLKPQPQFELGLFYLLLHWQSCSLIIMNKTRAEAWQLLNEHVQSPLIKHCLAVSSAMRAYARQYGADEELWGITGLLHDMDYEKFPDKHPFHEVEIFRAQGYPEEMIQAILGHALYSGVPRESQLAKCLFAVDELCGFVMACAYVRPTKLEGLEVKSVKKRLKEKSFAAKVNREEIAQGMAELGVNEDEHIALVISAMRGIAGELGF